MFYYDGVRSYTKVARSNTFVDEAEGEKEEDK